MKLFLRLSFGLLITLSSCKKDKTTNPIEDVAQQPTFNDSNVQQLIANLSTPLETFTLDAASSKTFVCNNGTRILINPNAFLTASGAIVSGIINIEVKDILSKKDMILNNAIPISNGQLLVSGGEVYFNATQSGQQLKINPLSSVTLYVPIAGTPFSSMKAFYSQGPSSLSNTNLNWSTANKSIAVSGLGTPYQGYVFGIDSLRWTNCDFFNSYMGSKTTCTVNLNGSYNNSNSTVLLSMNGVNTMARLFSSNTSVSQEFKSYINSIPVGINYTIVVFSCDGTNYYYGSQAITMTTDMVINLPALTLSSKAAIINSLSLLP